MFYLTTHSTHFILRLHDVGHMVKDHSDSERGNLLPPHGLLFPINSKGSFICTIPQTYHSLCCGALAGTRNSSMGPPYEGSIRRPITPWVNTLTTEQHLAPVLCNDVLDTFYLLLLGVGYMVKDHFDIIFIIIIIIMKPRERKREWIKRNLLYSFYCLHSAPFFFPVPDRGTSEFWYLCPWQACATTACSECTR